mmetsp:Transcript_32139/g.44564  ORF Transcript_32139/g.44564 Transcript_32139/m.44564 type:complete len:170 (+) Transcript_32139:415-924(+)
MALYAKFGSLLVKQVSKPLANYLKASAKNHPVFRSWLVAFAQKKHNLSARISSALRQEGSPRVFAGKLNEERALQQGSDFFGEAVIFSIAGGIVVYEYRRSALKDEEKSRKKKDNQRQKELQRKEEQSQIHARLEGVEKSVELLMLEMRDLKTRSDKKSNSRVLSFLRL